MVFPLMAAPDPVSSEADDCGTVVIMALTIPPLVRRSEGRTAALEEVIDRGHNAGA